MKATLERTLSIVAGIAIEVTVLKNDATFSFEGKNDSAVSKIINFFAGKKQLEVDYDEECDFTCIYMAL
ncbi:MAG: hypothetical protein QM653_15795 [Dysgonomonas sp.]|uniref:hypothetical protein n=1 Tax=Dysgonomonas sp. TaxID=1891233 RepID=UPI0039E6CF9A